MKDDEITMTKDFTFNNIKYILVYKPHKERISYGIFAIPKKGTSNRVLSFGLADSVDDAINNFTKYGIRNGQQ